MGTLVNLVDARARARDDGVFGEALVRAGVAGTGHTPRDIEQYIREQRAKAASDQSFRTTARGLRELYRLLRFINDTDRDAPVEVTALGRQAAAFAGRPLGNEQLRFWRRAILDLRHTGGGDVSHPYQVLLRLVARKPGITRAKCALALEARNDSPEELDRIVALADLPEDQIRARIGVTKSNWDNAKKVLPRFAEQLGDVIKTGENYRLADAPGRADAGEAEPARGRVEPAHRAVPARAEAVAGDRREGGVRAPRTSRAVTIGRAATADDWDEVQIPPDLDPVAAAEAARLRRERLRRHNLIVQELARRLTAAGARLFEDPFDVLALVDATGILSEVKTLDGTEADERDRVQEALAQLLYYEGFVTQPVVGEAPIRKIACFERATSEPHRQWLNRQGIGVIWKERDGFGLDALARDFLGRIVEQLG